MTPSPTQRSRLFIILVLLTAAMPALADWPNTNATKWVQFPDPTQNGFDVLAAQPAAGALPLILADDFLCRKTGPITDIHIWASWLNDTNVCNLPITLSIWSDVPAITNVQPPVPSHPGTRLWTQTFAPGQYAARPWKTADELFWNPDPFPCGQIWGTDHLIWQYNFYPSDPFVQQGTPNAPVVYWLSMTVGANVVPFGWKTSTNHWNDDAVFGHQDPNGNPLGDWQELRDPKDPACHGRSLDLSFAITTKQVISNPPPVTNKWVQYPDVFNGLDVNDTFPNILADDFLCTSAGSLTNIQIWASGRDDVTPNPNTKFVLGIWSDVPGNPFTGANPYSHPGHLLWTETFVPGSYGVRFYTNGNEMFYDQNTGQLTPETAIWLYNFNPKQPFCQKGSPNTPVVYWLSVYAVTPNGIQNFGWKTSTNHWNDDAVYGHLTAAGGAIGDWKELFDPRLPNLVSLDLAFVINNGPPSPDCDDQIRPKFIQWPDPSTNGLDVHATYPKVTGDDFLCRRPGPINGVTIWGSWKDDKVDTNATFRLSLWTDVPAVPGASKFSHPGELLCSEVFYPPTAVGTSLQRYKFGIYADHLLERFYDPDLPGNSGLIGSDTQIWRYDFYPRLPCWRQVGTPSAPRVYWITVSANTQNIDQYLFGWKTSTNHWNDDGVWGHMQNPTTALGDWKDLHHPLPPTNSLDLSFALRSFPIVGINKDLRNVMQPAQTAAGVQIVVAGIHEVTWHYDDSPAWPSFAVSYSGGNTVLQWTGKTVPTGVITHVGFEMGGTSITIVSMAWLSAASTPIGTPIQVNHHTWNNGTTLSLNNDIAGAPVAVLGGTVEFFVDPTPLNLMVPGGNRNPIATSTLPIQPGMIAPGCPLRIPVPQAPTGAQYVMFQIQLADQQGQQATMDFLQLPLDTALTPILSGADAGGGTLHLRWFSVPDRSYRIQMAPDLRSSFFDIFTELPGMPDETDQDIPMNGPQGYYRVILDPE